MNLEFLEKYRGRRVAVAVSGGADSICLLQIFYENASAYEIALSAITCEHGIRGEESLRDLEFIKVFCAWDSALHLFRRRSRAGECFAKGFGRRGACVPL